MAFRKDSMNPFLVRSLSTGSDDSELFEMMKDDIAMAKFRESIRLGQIHPELPHGARALKYLEEYGKELGAGFKVIGVGAEKPYVLLTVEGRNPDLPSLLLLSSHLEELHHQVVNQNGKLLQYGHFDLESLTMEHICVGIQYLEAIRRLKSDNQTLLRTVHVLFTPGPEEEFEKGYQGLDYFIRSAEFSNLNVGVAMDEANGIGLTDTYLVFNQERCLWKLRAVCTGNHGHPGTFVHNCASEKLSKLLDAISNYRKGQEQLMSKKNVSLGEVSTVNLTRIQSSNEDLVAFKIVAEFDAYVPQNVDHQTMKEQMIDWQRIAGPGVHIQLLSKEPADTPAELGNDNPWWNAIQSVFERREAEFKVQTSPTSTNARCLRSRGVWTVSLSVTSRELHAPFTPSDSSAQHLFLNGIPIYEDLITSLANLAF